MTYTVPVSTPVVHLWHAQALAALVPEELLMRRLQGTAPKVAEAVMASHRNLTAWARRTAAEGAVVVVTPEPTPAPLQSVPGPPVTGHEWISTTTAAALIGISERMVRYAANAGRIASKQDRDGGPLFIDRVSAEAYRAARAARERRAA